MDAPPNNAIESSSLAQRLFGDAAFSVWLMGAGAFFIAFIIQAGRDTNWAELNLLSALGSLTLLLLERLASHAWLLTLLAVMFIAALILLEYLLEKRNLSRRQDN